MKEIKEEQKPEKCPQQQTQNTVATRKYKAVLQSELGAIKKRCKSVKHGESRRRPGGSVRQSKRGMGDE